MDQVSRKSVSQPHRILLRLSLLGGGFLLVVFLGSWYMISMPGRSYSGPLPPLKDFTLRERLEKHVHKLAGEIGERNLWQYDELQNAVSYLEATFQEMGYKPARQNFEVGGKTVCNLAMELGGNSQSEEIIVVGAHYDSVMGCPGANDNASGVAALIEMARLLKDHKLARTVRFVAFVNEEQPFFETEGMGSQVYARSCRQREENITAMISLETIGCYSDEENSQEYPFPFSLFYPNKGNFIGFVGNTASRNLVHQSIASFREHAQFPSEGIAAPEVITGISWSDHWSFWQEGYPAIMVTDTAPFRYEYYHLPEDTPDKIDYDRMTRVTKGLAAVVADLAEEKE